MYNELPTAKASMSSECDETNMILESPPRSPSHSSRQNIQIKDQESNLSHIEKLDILRQAAPKFTDDLKFWPLFDTAVLSRYSFAFFYYYELYKFILKLLVIITIVTVIFRASYSFLKLHGNDEAEIWIFYGYGIITLIAIRIFSLMEGKRVLRERDHQTDDWTENKFALLMEGLPLEANKKDIKEFVEEKLQENGLNETVKEVILVQDCSRFLTVEKKIRKKQYQQKKAVDTREELIDDIIRLENEREEILGSAQALELYKGTAIVIFKTVRGKIAMENYFRLSDFKRFLYAVFPSCLGKRYRLKGEIGKVKEAPEPSDIIFQRMYVPKIKRVWRKYLAYFLGALAVLMGIGVLISLRITHNNRELATWMNFPIYIYTALIVVTTLIIYLVTDFLLEKIAINRTRSACELGKIKFRMNISFLNINVYLVALMYFMPNFSMVQDQIILTSLILAVLIPLRKIFSVIRLDKIRLRRKLYRDPDFMERYTQNEIIEIFTNPQYDFANNIEDSICYMFVALGFYFIGQLYIVAVTLLGLIISICVDKLVMVYLTSPTSIKGSEMGLEFFRVLKWDLKLQLLTLAFIPNHIFSTGVPVALRITLMVIFGIFMVWDFRGNMRKSWKHKWSKQREGTKYDDVEKYFHHTYKDAYPFKVY